MFADYNATSNGQFNIFHHYEDDVYDYDQNEHRAASPAAAPNSTVPITTGTVSLSTLKPAFVAPTTPVDDGKIAPDQRGRLCVRAAMLRKLGVKPGDEVCIDIEPADEERALITVDGIHPGVPICLKVDKDNCLRISRGTLGEIFETLPSSFKVEFVTDAIGGNCIVLE
ncbi:MAG: hypothetical protein HOG49_08790 [Candidatus Scalindua sp.]|nr:hypothetical protein [Candidatus Scalindua sp.]